jgi:hypothetical protein
MSSTLGADGLARVFVFVCVGGIEDGGVNPPLQTLREGLRDRVKARRGGRAERAPPLQTLRKGFAIELGQDAVAGRSPSTLRVNEPRPYKARWRRKLATEKRPAAEVVLISTKLGLG